MYWDLILEEGMYVLCILYWNGSKIVSSDGYLDDIS